MYVIYCTYTRMWKNCVLTAGGMKPLMFNLKRNHELLGRGWRKKRTLYWVSRLQDDRQRCKIADYYGIFLNCGNMRKSETIEDSGKLC